MTLATLLALDPAHLAQYDVAAVNLLCAEGLPGAEGLDRPRCLALLDEWAKRIGAETERNLHRFRERPLEYENSEAFFRMGMLVTVLQQDLGVRYNPDRIESPTSPSPNGVFFADSQDLFLHGLLGDRRMGTCVSLPVLYVAVARRLGYPVKLVSAKSHLFVRWEGKERINIEGAGQGINSFPDGHYRTWPMPIGDAEMKACRYLQSMTPAQELAVFLATRGQCLMSAEKVGEARRVFAKAGELVPGSPEYAFYLASAGAAVPPDANARRPLTHGETDAMAQAVADANYARAVEASADAPPGSRPPQRQVINPEPNVPVPGVFTGLPAVPRPSASR
jgi:hypothetical protein